VDFALLLQRTPSEQGVLKASVEIVADYRGHRFTATITVDGQVEFEGRSTRARPWQFHGRGRGAEAVPQWESGA
jgi:hypothetical protein